MDNCDEFKDLSKFILKKDTILYSGNTMDKEIVDLKHVFKYIGQRGKDVESKNYVLYASSDFNVAWGYASSCQRHGYIHKFIVTKDVELIEGDVFEDAELIDKCVCKNENNGYAVIYAPEKDEYALCNSHEFLEYVSSIKCIFDKNAWITLTFEDYADNVGIVASDLMQII